MEIFKLFERKTLGAVFVASLGLTAMTGCGGEPEIVKNQPATVVGHEFHEEYDTFYMVGKTPMFIHYDAEYHLDVRQCDRAGDEFADENGCVTAHVDVNATTFNQYQDGSEILFAE